MFIYLFILEDGPEIPKASGPHAQEGGEILKGIYAEDCTSLRDAKIGVDGKIQLLSWKRMYCIRFVSAFSCQILDS
jgi:hypothetical protein